MVVCAGFANSKKPNIAKARKKILTDSTHSIWIGKIVNNKCLRHSTRTRNHWSKVFLQCTIILYNISSTLATRLSTDPPTWFPLLHNRQPLLLLPWLVTISQCMGIIWPVILCRWTLHRSFSHNSKVAWITILWHIMLSQLLREIPRYRHT